jgi:hypothetical protein
MCAIFRIKGGLLKQPNANFKKRANRYCRNVVLGSKNAKVHHYMLWCIPFSLQIEEAERILAILSSTKRRRRGRRRRRRKNLNALIHIPQVMMLIHLACIIFYLFLVIGNARYAETTVISDRECMLCKKQ